MVIKRVLCVPILTMIISTAEMAIGATPTGKTFPTLTIGVTTYTNLTITDVSGGSIFLRHSRGFESLRIDSLDSKTLSELDIQAPAPDKKAKPAARAAGAAPAGETLARTQSSHGDEPPQGKLFGEMGAKLDGTMAVVIYGVAAVGGILLIVSNILFIVAAFQTGPWWGVGVLFGSFTCGIVPLIFFFTHLDECKKPFFIGVAGFLLFVGLGVTVPSYVRAREAAEAKKHAMIPQMHQAWA